MAAMIANRFAFSDEAWAPATSPEAYLPLTWAAKTIDAMPNGRQQKIVDRMAQTR